jgi:hypothetical protein
MTIKPLFSLFLLIIIVLGCYDSTTTNKKNWYKGNLHTHSYWSDGDEFPEVIMEWYKTRGYNFLALTDHNTIADTVKWKQISNDSIYQVALKNYLDRFKDYDIELKEEQEHKFVKLKKFSEYSPIFEEAGQFIMLQGEEISAKYKNSPLHLNGINLQRFIKPRGGNSVAEVLQNNINAVNEQQKETNTEMLVQINHPNFGDAISPEDMMVLYDNRFFEVFNGHPAVQNEGSEKNISTEDLWDRMNIAYLKEDKEMLYGIATDDSHNYHYLGKRWSNAGRGWIQVWSEKLSPPSLIKAMEKGDFYASTGVELKEITHEDGNLSIIINSEVNVTYSVEFIGCMKGDTNTRILKVIQGKKGSFKLPSNLLFVRARIISNSPMENPVYDGQLEMAWTQPIKPN